jgi:hypothetical protein
MPSNETLEIPLVQGPPSIRAAEVLAAEFPGIVDFEAAGMTPEEVHYFLGESAAVAFFQYQSLMRP